MFQETGQGEKPRIQNLKEVQICKRPDDDLDSTFFLNPAVQIQSCESMPHEIHVLSTTDPCHLCPTTRILCFWGELRPYAPWRRFAVIVLSTLFLIGIGVLAWQFAGHANQWVLWIVGIPVLLFSILGVLVAFWGCNACVMRLYGEV
jgi:hypothetical protein